MKNIVISNVKIWFSVGCLLIVTLIVMGSNRSTANDYGEYLTDQDMVDDTVAVTTSNDNEPITDDDLAWGFDNGNYIDDGSVIDIMVLYSPIVPGFSSGQGSDVDTDIAMAIQTANLTNLNSGVGFQFNLVHAQSISGLDTFSHDGDLAAVSSSAEVAQLRDEYHADLVSYWNIAGNGCGKAYVPQTLSPDNEQYGFSVVSYNCVAAPAYSFIHEMGHNFGLAHDPAANGVDPALPYGHGYAVPGEFRTIMATSATCDQARCDRIPNWSSPNVSYLGTSTGVADEQDSTRALNAAALTVANYRSAAEGCHVEYTYREESDHSAMRVQVINTGDTQFDGVHIMWEQPGITELKDELFTVNWFVTGDATGFLMTDFQGEPIRIVEPGEKSVASVARAYQDVPAPPNPDSFSVNGISCTSEEVEIPTGMGV